jgi:ACR3 family arsenite efflux pump ArsB
MPLLGAVRLTGMVVDQVAVNAGFDFRATVIGLLIGVPVMLTVVWIVNRPKVGTKAIARQRRASKRLARAISD